MDVRFLQKSLFKRAPMVFGSLILFAITVGAFQNCSEKVDFVEIPLLTEGDMAIPNDSTYPYGTIRINAGAGYTNNINVQLQIEAKNATEMILANGVCPTPDAQWQPLEIAKTWLLADLDGLSRVKMILRSQEGRVSPCGGAAIVLDRKAPQAVFVTTPSKMTKINTASFVLGAIDEVSGAGQYYCRVNESTDFALCASKVSLTNRLEGNNSLSFYVVDKAGNQSDAIEYSWLVDLTAPTLAVTAKPPLVSTISTVVTVFEGADLNGSGVESYACKLNASIVANCVSPLVLGPLADGVYTLTITAKDKVGWVSAPATVQFSIDSKPSGAFQILGVTGGQDLKVDMYLTDLATEPTVWWTKSLGAQKYIASILSADGATICTSPEATGDALFVALTGCALSDNTKYIVRVSSFKNGLETKANSFNLTVDASAPTVQVTQILTNDELKTAKIDFVMQDLGTGVKAATCYRVYGANTSTYDCTDKTSIDFSSLVAGDYQFYITATDFAGNMVTSTLARFTINKIVCDPFNTTREGLCKKGLRANLYYASAADRALGSSYLSSTFNLVDKLISQGVKSNAILYLSQLDVTARPFQSGFVSTDGSLLKDDGGNTLDEWFALDLDTVLKLEEAAPTSVEGMYQLMVISDDGAVVKVDSSNNNTYRTLINNDGQHTVKVGCSAVGDILTLTKSSRIPVKIRYFQGPRTELAVSLYWRKVSAPTAAQSMFCGFSSASLAEVNGWGSGTGTGEFYKRIQNEGFKPLAPGNFILKENM